MAARIRGEAYRNGVPVIEDKTLALRFFDSAGSGAPEIFEVRQTATLDDNRSVPLRGQFGSDITGITYGLQSTQGAVVFDGEMGRKVEGSDLELAAFETVTLSAPRGTDGEDAVLLDALTVFAGIDEFGQTRPTGPERFFCCLLRTEAGAPPGGSPEWSLQA